MATVQSLIQRLAQRNDPRTKQGGELGVWTISTVTKSATPSVYLTIVTTTNNGVYTGDSVLLAGVTTLTSVNGLTFTATRLSPTTFTVVHVTSSGNGTGGTATTIGVSEGDAFTPQRLLDAFNEARAILVETIKSLFPSSTATEAISGQIVDSQITFAAAGNKQTYSLPSGYLQAISLMGYSYGDNQSAMTKVGFLPATKLNVLLRGDPVYAQDVSHRFVSEVGSQLVHNGLFLGSQQLSGILTVTAGSATVVGSDTKFLTECAIGAKITVASFEKTVLTITSDTVLTVDSVYTLSTSGLTAYYSGPRPMTGTMQIVDGSNALAGTSTHFLTECIPGGIIDFGANGSGVIDEITSDTALTITSTWLTNASGLSGVYTGYVPLAGTVNVENKSVVGIGTAFATKTLAGGYLRIGAAVAQIYQVISATVLTIVSHPTGTLTGTIATTKEGTFATGTGTRFTVEAVAGMLLTVGTQGQVMIKTIHSDVLIEIEETFEKTQSGKVGVVEILAGIVGASASYQGYLPLTGTVAYVALASTLAGTLTAFDTETAAGGTISVGGIERIVNVVTNPTGLSVTVAWPATQANFVGTVQNYLLRYFGITPWTLSDVTNGTSVETINTRYHEMLIELASAACNELGSREIAALAKKLLGAPEA